jgi:NADPH:quinone reductase-like Zn-dependent oxidoreductase
MQERSDQPSAGRSRAAQLDVREIPAPEAGPGQVRVRVTAAGLNPMDWFMTADADTAARFGLSLPAGFGTDYAGVVDQVGDGVSDFAPGDRVFGSALSRAVADFVVISPAGSVAANEAHHTPDGVDDRTAATLTIAGRTASAAMAVVKPGPDDTVLIGGAAGGVGVFAVQLARIAGARVIGTGSATSADFLRDLGAEPVAYGGDRPLRHGDSGRRTGARRPRHAHHHHRRPDRRHHTGQRRQRGPRCPGRDRSPGCRRPTPRAHRRNLPA